MNPDFWWVDGDLTTGIWPQCSTEDSEYGDLRSSREPWQPTLPNGEPKRRLRRLLRVLWLLTCSGSSHTTMVWDREAGQQVGGSPEGNLLASLLLSRNTGEIPAENCPTRKFFAALQMSEQSSFWAYKI